MKKLIIAALAAVIAVSGIISASASCRYYCPNEDCINAGYCIEECPNNGEMRRDRTGAQRRTGRGGHHGGRHCGGAAYCHR